MRAYLISRQDQFDFEEFATYYSSALTVSWPYSDEDIIQAASSKAMIASPIFEQHWQNLKNWNVRQVFRRKFTVVGDIIDAQIEDL